MSVCGAEGLTARATNSSSGTNARDAIKERLRRASWTSGVQGQPVGGSTFSIRSSLDRRRLSVSSMLPDEPASAESSPLATPRAFEDEAVVVEQILAKLPIMSEITSRLQVRKLGSRLYHPFDGQAQSIERRLDEEYF